MATLDMTIIALGCRVLYVNDDKVMWGKMSKKAMMLSIAIAVIVLMNFLKFYFDFPKFFQFF